MIDVPDLDNEDFRYNQEDIVAIWSNNSGECAVKFDDGWVYFSAEGNN